MKLRAESLAWRELLPELYGEPQACSRLWKWGRKLKALAPSAFVLNPVQAHGRRRYRRYFQEPCESG
jgi:hypothetical protein